MEHPLTLAKPDLIPELGDFLQYLRNFDSFTPENYVLRKCALLNEYMRVSGLSSCVVSVSGGLDSAVVLALVNYASRMRGSPIKRVVPVLLPVFTQGAATNQCETVQRGKELCTALRLTPVVIDLSSAHATTKGLVDTAMGHTGGGWASGQLVSYQRTPALYYVTSLLQEQMMPGVVVGTTNRDEGAYLGNFGKASDGLVDLQLISDVHKSQVYQLSRLLGVPDSILDAAPAGDFYDGRVDEEVFGTSYDFVELFLRAKMSSSVRFQMEGLSQASTDQYESLAARVEELHRLNHHKYLGKSPAVHFDLWNCRMEGGWNYFNYSLDGA